MLPWAVPNRKFADWVVLCLVHSSFSQPKSSKRYIIISIHTIANNDLLYIQKNSTKLHIYQKAYILIQQIIYPSYHCNNDGEPFWIWNTRATNSIHNSIDIKLPPSSTAEWLGYEPGSPIATEWKPSWTAWFRRADTHRSNRAYGEEGWTVRSKGKHEL